VDGVLDYAHLPGTARSGPARTGHPVLTRTAACAPGAQRIYERGFNLVGIGFHPENATYIAEELQVLRYELGQEYRVRAAL
jgi:hypothetical protein